MTTTKTIKNKTVGVKNVQKLFGSPLATYDVTVINERVVAEAEWKRRKPKVPTLTPMTITRRNQNDNLYKSGSPDFIQYEGTIIFCYPSTIVDTVTTNSDNGTLALARARAKVSDFNFGETLVEFGDTLGLLNKNLKRALDFYTAIRRGKWDAKGLRDHHVPKAVKNLPASKRLSSGWLEFSFGWMPIYSDIHAGIEAYGRTMSTKGDSITKRSGNTRVKTLKTVPGGKFLDASSIEANATFKGIVSNSFLYEANRLGLANPLLMAWNKLPFSFLADWFLPISPLLGSMTAGIGLTNELSQRTTRSLSVQTVRGVGPWDQTYQVIRHPPNAFAPLDISQVGRNIRFGLWKTATSIALVRSVLMK